jgi:hypothetical protein
MGVALSIVFTGLCALVTDGDRAPGEILLVDAKGVGEVGGVALPEHAPTLVVNLGELSNADTSAPTRVITAGPGRDRSSTAGDDRLTVPPAVDQIGIWDLTGTEVRIRVQGGEATGLALYRAPEGTSSWPQPPPSPGDPMAWRDLRFVVSMDALTGDGRVDPALLAPGGAGPGTLPRSVSARIHLDRGRLEAGMPSQEIHRDDVYEFCGGGARLRQALTDSVRWSLEADTGAVVVEIVPVSGGPSKRLAFGPSATPHNLFVSNLPAENGSHDPHHTVGDEEMGVLHFAAYYALLMNEPSDRPLPRLLPSAAARRGAGLHGRPHCGAAMFRRR